MKPSGKRARPSAAIHVAVLATHTHGGPACLPEAFLGPVDQATLDLALTGALEAAADALADLAPATLSLATEKVPGVARNRRSADGPVDHELSVLTAWRPGQTAPAGALVSFALHPVVLGADNLLITRDYPGYLLDALEREHPGLVPLFACGCAGDVNHGHSAEASWTTRPVAERTFAKAEEIGEQLAAAASRAMASAHRSPPLSADVSAASTVVSLPLAGPPDALRSLERFEAAVANAIEAGDVAAAALNEELVAWATAQLRRGGAAERSDVAGSRGEGDERVSSEPSTLDVELQAFHVGGLSLLFLPGEPFAAFGLRLKGYGSDAVLPLAYANAAPGYLPTSAELAKGGYEVDLAYMYYGAPAPFATDVEEVLIRAATGLLRRY